MKRVGVAAAVLALAGGAWLYFARDPASATVAWGREQLAAKDYDAALRAADGVLRTAPRHADALALRAMALSKLGRPAEALAAFEAAPPRNVEERFLLGSALMMAGRTGPAAEELERVVAAEPNHFAAHWALAQLSIALGKTAEAAAHASAAAGPSAEPRQRALGLWLAFKLKHELGDWAGSHAAYEALTATGEAGRLLPETGEAVVERAAENLLRLRRFDEAVRLVDDLRAGERGRAGTLIRARAAEARGDRALALEFYAHAARRHGEAPALWLSAIGKAKDFGRPEIAGPLAAEAFRKFPGDAALKKLAAEFPAAP